MWVEKSVTDFVDGVAADSPVPGGGGVAALAGALGTALGLMVAHITENKEGFEKVQEEILGVKRESVLLKEKLLRAVDGDAAAYMGIVNARKLPRVTEEEVQVRKAAIQKATHQAAEFALQVAECCVEVIGLARRILAVGNPNAASESLGAGLMGYAGAQLAIVTAELNINNLTDPGESRKLLGMMHHLRERTDFLEEKLRQETDDVVEGTRGVHIA